MSRETAVLIATVTALPLAFYAADVVLEREHYASSACMAELLDSDETRPNELHVDVSMSWQNVRTAAIAGELYALPADTLAGGYVCRVRWVPLRGWVAFQASRMPAPMRPSGRTIF